ncbi:hypothetical protein EJ04DRAFT_420116, partial [Polyplosphaeria fusca]
IHETHLSPDSSCIFTSDYARHLTVYTHTLHPYARLRAPEPIRTFTPHPLFNYLSSPTTLLLTSIKDRPITLHNALWPLSASPPPSPNSVLDITTPLATYPLVNPLTEAFIAPSSLIFNTSGTHFLAGSKNTLSIFDTATPGPPTTTLRTIPSSRNKLKHGGVGYKGEISALALSSSTHMLAAGTRDTRCIGLYDISRSTECVTHFSLHAMLQDGLGGAGITQLRWSACGTYLFAAERCADSVVVYDRRKMGFGVGWCGGRRAETRQRLGFDVWEGEGGTEVWGGGTDGRVRGWRDPWMKEGRVEADRVVEVGEGAVVSALVREGGRGLVVARGVVDVGGGGEGRVWGGEGMGRQRWREWGALDVVDIG